MPQSALSFDFAGPSGVSSSSGNAPPRVSAKKRLGTRAGAPPPHLATVTILPDAIGDEEFKSVQMLASLRMVADIEEEASVRHHQHQMQAENIFNRHG